MSIQFINRFKEFFRQHDKTQHLEEVDIYNFLENSFYSFSEIMYEKNLRLILDIDDNVPQMALIDFTRLKVTLTEIISTVIDSDLFKEIILEVTPKNDRLYFSLYENIAEVNKHKITQIIQEMDIDNQKYIPHIKKLFDEKYTVQFSFKYKTIKNYSVKFNKQIKIALFIKSSSESLFINKFLTSLGADVIEFSENSDLKELVHNISRINEYSYVFVSDSFLDISNQKTFKLIKDEYIVREKIVILMFDRAKSIEVKQFKLNSISANPLSKHNFYESIISYDQKLCTSLAERKNKIILIVEDNEVNAEVFLEYLKLCNLKGEIAFSGFQALEKIKNSSYDMIFTDIQLPDIDGFEIARIIRKDNKFIPIIAVTVQLYSGYEEKYANAGIDEYIAKPVIFEELQKIVFKYLNLTCIDFDEIKKEYGDRIFETLVKNHLKFIGNYIKEFQESLDGTDETLIKRRAHKLKGSISNFKMNKILRLLNEIIHTDINIDEMRVDGTIIINEINDLNKELLKLEFATE